MTRYRCSKCEIVSFTRKSSARRHIENTHLGLGNIMDFDGFPVHIRKKLRWNGNDVDQDETGKTLVTPADIIYVEELLREWARLDAREMFLKDIYLRNVTTKMVLDLYNNVRSGRTGILRATEDFIDSYNKAQAAVDLLNTLNKKKPKSSKGEGPKETEVAISREQRKEGD